MIAVSVSERVKKHRRKMYALRDAKKAEDARMLEAAPDLLDVAKELDEHINSFRGIPLPVLDRLRAAIAKAEGVKNAL